MNLSRAISQIILQQGLYQLSLPFTEPTEAVIANVLRTVTIPEYSQFVPNLKTATVNVAGLKCVDNVQKVYLLPEQLTTTPVMYVSNVQQPIGVERGLYGDVAMPFGVARSIQGVISHQAYMMALGQARSEPTFEYLGENRIRLYGFPKSYVTIEVACEHDENGESIPASCSDSFMQLATLDTKIFLFNTLKLYDGLPSAWGSLNLKIDDLSSAEGDRVSLLDNWRDTFHVDMAFNWVYM